MSIALFFDTETTGFKHGDFIPEIVQIGAVLQDTETKRVLAELNVIVRSKEPIPEEVSKIHGITDELVMSFGMGGSKVESMFTDMVAMADVAVAHNIEFDLGIIRDVWPAASRVLTSREQFCTMRRATDVIKLPRGTSHGKSFGQHKPPKLIEAYQYFFNNGFDNAHDAMADVRACRDVYFALIESRKESLNV